MQAFEALLRGHAAAVRRLSAELGAEHGLTLSDFEVLLRLARAPERRMRRVDLAEQVLLTASGVTRLLDGLEAQGYVERAACPTDRRVVYAVLTERGAEKLRRAAAAHLAQVEALLGRFEPDELETLTGLLARLAEAEPVSECPPPRDV